MIEASSVNEHENASTQTAAFTISNKNQMSVTFNATADAATALSIGDEVAVQKSGNDYTAIITSIDSKADDGTGLFPVEAQIQDDGGALLSGVTVKVSAATQRAENALLVPIDSVYYEDGQAYVLHTRTARPTAPTLKRACPTARRSSPFPASTKTAGSSPPGTPTSRTAPRCSLPRGRPTPKWAPLPRKPPNRNPPQGRPYRRINR